MGPLPVLEKTDSNLQQHISNCSYCLLTICCVLDTILLYTTLNEVLKMKPLFKKVNVIPFTTDEVIVAMVVLSPAQL